MTGIAADSTYDVGSEVALLRTVIFTMSNLTAYQTLSSVETVVVGCLTVLASLVLIVTQCTV